METRGTRFRLQMNSTDLWVFSVLCAFQSEVFCSVNILFYIVELTVHWENAVIEIWKLRYASWGRGAVLEGPVEMGCRGFVSSAPKTSADSGHQRGRLSRVQLRNSPLSPKEAATGCGWSERSQHGLPNYPNGSFPLAQGTARYSKRMFFYYKLSNPYTSYLMSAVWTEDKFE